MCKQLPCWIVFKQGAQTVPAPHKPFVPLVSSELPVDSAKRSKKKIILHDHFYDNDTADSPLQNHARVWVNTSQLKSQQQLPVPAEIEGISHHFHQ